MPSWARVVPLLALWLVPVLAIAIALPLAANREVASVSPDLPDRVVVGLRTDDHRTAVLVDAELSTAPAIRTQASGLVTAVEPIEGDVVTGQSLLAVNGVPVYAFRSASPLYRDLQRGASGDDVAALAQFLSARGLLDPSAATARFGNAMRTAVRAFQAELGVTKDGIFRLSYVAFVPATVTGVEPSSLQVGDSVAAGDSILTGRPVALSLAFRPLADGLSLSDLAEGALVLRFGDTEIPVSALSPSDDVAALYASLRDAVATQAAQETRSEDGTSTTFAGGVLALAEGEARGVVPSTAVYVAESGASCVFVDDDGRVTAESLEFVAPANGELGSSYVPAEYADATIVRDALSVSSKVKESCG